MCGRARACVRLSLVNSTDLKLNIPLHIETAELEDRLLCPLPISPGREATEPVRHSTSVQNEGRALFGSKLFLS